jgi:DNA-binding CsgD family transcriptional regulator
VVEVHAPRLVGRASELERLTATLARPPALALVEGEAGIGKSRLVHEALLRLGPDDRRTWTAVCPPFRDALTLGPIVDAARQAGDGPRGLRLSPLAGTLRPLFPEWAADLPPAPEPIDDAGAARHRLMRALAELIGAFGVDRLIVEDVHWADEATLDFLIFLLARRPPPVSLVLTYRREDLPDGSLLLRLSSRPPDGMSCTRIALGLLGVADTAELVSSMLDGRHVAGDLVALLHERTDGVPLALEESVRLLNDRDDLVRGDGEWLRRTAVELSVPGTIRDAVAERAARLSVAGQLTLRATAVLGEAGDHTTVRAVSGLAASRSRAAVDEAVRSGLLREDARGGIGFRHALAAQAVYDGTAAPDRRALHRRAGRALERLDPPPMARLARHFRAAGDTARWWRYGERAADLALASGDHLTSVTLLHELLSAPGLPAGDVARLARKIPIFAFTGYLGRTGLLDTLRTVLDDDRLSAHDRGEVRNQLGRMLMHAGQYAAGVTELHRAVPDLRDPLVAAQAMLILGRPGAVPQPFGVHRRWLARAGAMIPAVPGQERLGLFIDLVTAQLLMGDATAWELAGSLRLDEEPLHRARGSLNLGDATIRWGRYADARRHLTAALDAAEQHRYGRLRDMIRGTTAHLDWFTGAWDGLAERAAEFAGLVEDPVIQLDALLVAGHIAAATGRSGDAEEALQRVIADGRGLGILEMPLEAAAALARLRMAAGDVTGALALTGDAVTVVAANRLWFLGADVVPAHLEALVRVGRRDEARRLFKAYARGLGELRWQAPAAGAALATGRAVLAGADPRAWARAAHAWRALPRPYDALLALERQAGADTDLLTEVHRGLVALGATADADRVAKALPARTWRGGRRGYGDHLSPRELEVVRLMLSGLSNPDIARVLSRSPKTVAAQLKSAMRTHGVSSRTALAVSAMRAGIIPAGADL